MTDIKVIGFNVPDAKEQFQKSLHETGFAVLKDHPINKDLISSFYQVWIDFFNTEEKHKNTWLRDPLTHSGYFPYRSENAKGNPVKDLKEFFHIYPFSPLPTECEIITRKLYSELLDLGTLLLQWLEGGLPDRVKKVMTHQLPDMLIDSEENLMRVLHYPPIEEKEDLQAERAAAHEDINLITILLAGSEPGLQTKTLQGEWINVPYQDDMITVNSADMLQLATHNYYPSATHRVINPEHGKNNSRYSVPFFLHPRPDVKLSETHTAKTYLRERLKEIGLGEKK